MDSSPEGLKDVFGTRIDPFIPLSGETVIEFHPKKAIEMREREREYEEWLSKQVKTYLELEVIKLTNESNTR